MRKYKNIYVLVMKFHIKKLDGKYENEEYHDIHYSLEDAQEKVFDYIRHELWYFTSQQESPAMRNLIEMMNHGECTYELYVDEYSGRREFFNSQEKLYLRYKEITEGKNENLYEDLLALVDYQRYYLNPIGEVTRVETFPQKINGMDVSTGDFKREDCANGFIGSKFQYLNGDAKTEISGDIDGKFYFTFVNLRREKIDKNDITNWEPYMECFRTLEEALEAGIEHYYAALKEYIPNKGNPSRDLLDVVAKDKVWDSRIAVRIISNERVQCHTLKELTKYYTGHILDVKPENRYDFLLSLLQYDQRVYDSHGNYLRTENKHQYLEDKYVYSLLPLFTMENAKDLKYSI